GIARRDEADALAAIGPGEIGRHPHDITQIGRLLDADLADAVERDPVIASVDDRLEHRPDARVGVGDPLERLAVDRALGDGRRAERLVAHLLRLLDLAGRPQPERLDQQGDPGRGLAEDQRRAVAGENLLAQRFAGERVAIRLDHGEVAGIEFAGDVELGESPVPAPLDGKQLKQEHAQLGVRGILANLLLQVTQGGAGVTAAQPVLRSHSTLPFCHPLGAASAEDCHPSSRRGAVAGADHTLTFLAISQPTVTAASPVPSFFCGVYSTLNCAKFSVMFSVSRSSPPLPPVVTAAIIRSLMVILRYSSGFSPALRTVSSASGKCLPLQQYCMRLGLDLSTYLVNEMSCTLTLPAPAPVPM